MMMRIGDTPNLKELEVKIVSLQEDTVFSFRKVVSLFACCNCLLCFSAVQCSVLFWRVSYQSQTGSNDHKALVGEARSDQK